MDIKPSSVQSLICVRFLATPWTAACQASLSINNSRSFLRLMFIESVMPSNHLILCRLLLFPPSIFPSIRVFSNESVLHIRWPKYWSSSFSISPSNEYSGVISFRMGWLDLLTVQGTLMSLLHPQARPFLPLPSPPCHPRDSGESFPTPQFKSINSLVLRFLYSPTLTSIHDYWKNHSLD